MVKTQDTTNGKQPGPVRADFSLLEQIFQFRKKRIVKNPAEK